MPIYAYRCEDCGFAKDVLQKMSDAPLSDCPSCGKSSFKKQVTAAGFQLKGSGWYVTDFRGGSGGASAPAAASNADTGGASVGSASDSGTSAGAASSSASSSGSTNVASTTSATSTAGDSKAA